MNIASKLRHNVVFWHGLAGAVGALGFAPVNFFPAFLLAFGWFFWRLNETKKVFFPSFMFFWTLHVCCLYWLTYPLTINLDRYWILIPFAVAVVPAYFSLQLAIACWIARKISRDAFEMALLLPSICSGVMYFYGHFSLGFPWILPAYIWNCDEIFLQSLSLWGVYGFSFVTMLMSCLVGVFFLFLRRHDRKNTIIAASAFAFLFIFVTFFGIFRTNSHKTQFTSHRGRMVQCNLPQQEKSAPELAEQHLWKHLGYSISADDLDFVIWPEASLPYLYNETQEDIKNCFRSVLNPGTSLILGAVRQDLANGKIHNSVVVLDHRGNNIGHYDKVHLVPFGEYIPFRSIIPALFCAIANDIGDFDVGDGPRVLDIGIKMAMTICYEAVFPSNFLPKDETVDVIINLTNDAWFGPTSEPYQHLQIVRARSVEQGIPLVRCTNYGISAVFDPCGREICRIQMGTSGVADFRVPQKLSDETPYRKHGNLFFWLMILAVIGVISIKKLLTPKNTKKIFSVH
jgi:apolipoprotein N-acyltransferase